jgi:predicted SprT family Zn-dependent metalloprotease
VVLKRTLLFRSVAFTRYIIAHELAHAHLRNRGRTDQEDPEFAADSLAADWGFPRPSRIV